MIGERVRIAREICRLTQLDLAERTGVPLGTIGWIESGRTVAPLEDQIERIAAATGFPTSFFHLGTLPDLPEGHFRKLKRGTAKDEKQLRAQVRLVVELVQRAEQQVRLPNVAIEAIAKDVSLDDIEDIAQKVRDRLGVGDRDPIPNFMRAVERAGVIVVRLSIDLEDHDSYSTWPDHSLDGRPIIAISAGHPGDRDRANVGHELGHLVLHTLRPAVDGDLAETEAWRFAGAILFPREAAEELMQPPVTLRVLMAAKATYGTSIAFNAKRALDLHIITKEQFVSLRKQLSARGWTKEEPVDVACEKPVLMPKIVEHMGGDGSTKERAERMHVQTFFLPLISA
jgi:Zn-dependent peptidase ImmA (M78 family)/transcriptional regulator with XRE-family HTH domain